VLVLPGPGQQQLEATRGAPQCGPVDCATQHKVSVAHGAATFREDPHHVFDCDGRHHHLTARWEIQCLQDQVEGSSAGTDKEKRTMWSEPGSAQSAICMCMCACTYSSTRRTLRAPSHTEPRTGLTASQSCCRRSTTRAACRQHPIARGAGQSVFSPAQTQGLCATHPGACEE